MIDNIISETHDLKKLLGARDSFKNHNFFRDLANQIASQKALIKEPVVQCFVEDALEFEHVGKLVRTKRHINEQRSHYVFSLFNASYFPSLSLDFLAYRALDVHNELSTRFPSNTCPVVLERSTEGFQARVVVALFPENHIDNLQEQDDRIFYFIDKFVERHQRITQKMIRHVVHENDFELLRNATAVDIERASSHWVWLHEFHHRTGHMPLPKFLPWKSLKPLAGLEELRVDLHALQICMSGDAMPSQLAEMTYQFILAERLLRYPVEGNIKPNYDAVASQLLFNYLLSHGGIRMDNDLICLTGLLNSVLREFLERINAIEATVITQDPISVQRMLIDFVHEYVDFDPTVGDYRHLDYFWQVKQKLSV